MAKQIAFDIVARDKASKTFSKIGGAAKLLGVVGLGGIVTNAVQTEAQFGKTMNLMQAGSGASGKEMEKLRKLAMKMGADTQFSAGGAAEAMLELSRGGMKPATIQGGALAGTLTLAAAGQLELGEAANIAVKSMGQFGLKGKDMAGVAAALAGGANASSASVRDMAFALSQGGLAANSVGFSLQETTAVLAAFSNAGLEGSDAGTSMKTMLDRLQPTTLKAEGAMKALGAMTEDGRNKFIKANGEFKSAAQIAEVLRKGTEKMTEAEAKRTITQAFGSDAQRAATIFAKEGAKGIGKMLKATSDQTAAQKMANASMKGTGGALERMSGSLETASLAIGTMLAPAVVFLADGVGMAANAFVAFTPKLQAAAGFVKDNQTTFMALGATIAAVVAITKIHTAVMAVQAAGGLLPLLKATKLVTTATKVYAAVQWLLNAAMSANPVMLVVIAIAVLVAGLIIAYKKSETFRNIVNKAFSVVKNAGIALKNGLVSGFNAIKSAMGKVADFAGTLKSKVASGFNAIVDFVKGIPGRLRDLADKFGNAGAALIGAFVNGMKNAGGIISGIAGNVWNAVKSLLNGAIDKINSAVEFKINIPSAPDVHVNPPDIPHLARGGIVRARSGGRIVRVAEGGHDEAIVPLSGPHAPKGGGGGGIVINITGALDPVAVGRQVEQVLIKYQRSISRPLQITTT